MQKRPPQKLVPWDHRLFPLIFDKFRSPVIEIVEPASTHISHDVYMALFCHTHQAITLALDREMTIGKRLLAAFTSTSDVMRPVHSSNLSRVLYPIQKTVARNFVHRIMAPQVFQNRNRSGGIRQGSRVDTPCDAVSAGKCV